MKPYVRNQIGVTRAVPATVVVAPADTRARANGERAIGSYTALLSFTEQRMAHGVNADRVQ